MNAARSSKPILVLGGTGKTGRRIVERLEKLGVPTRVGSRSANPSFDWEDRTTWPGALEGTSAVYVSYFPDLAVPGAPEAVRAFAELAVNSGVRRLVLLSGRGEEEAERAEQLIQASGADWTILRASWFNQNFSENFLRDAILDGTIALPVGGVMEPFVDAEDIADVAVAALTENGHEGRLYELTGPRLLTFADAIDEIARASKKSLTFVEITPAQYADALTQLAVPGDFVSLVMYLFTTVLDGRNAHLTDGVQRALGRAPRDFADYARETAATGVWESPA
ncbi:MAG: NAD(P)H-binding protein [Acidobacteria bacterium]|nr:NAD(P)H-binding protein [Acidobacteriota bacterium]MCH8946926.1 NAD(P)H-binding protein [Acidobacteriota bacterium]